MSLQALLSGKVLEELVFEEQLCLHPLPSWPELLVTLNSYARGRMLPIPPLRLSSPHHLGHYELPPPSTASYYQKALDGCWASVQIDTDGGHVHNSCGMIGHEFNEVGIRMGTVCSMEVLK